jgi:hypothetical protein
MPAAGVMVFVVAIALMFGTSVDPYSLMILATATYSSCGWPPSVSPGAAADGPDRRPARGLTPTAEPARDDPGRWGVAAGPLQGLPSS